MSTTLDNHPEILAEYLQEQLALDLVAEDAERRS